MKRLGDSRKAEELLREALQDIRLEEDRSEEELIHYHLMVAIARQGRTDDARRYSDTHFALISPEESKHGDLDEIMQRDREEKELYNKAKGIIAARNIKVSESWWTEHRVALNRAQLRYGLLVPERELRKILIHTKTLRTQQRKSKRENLEGWGVSSAGSTEPLFRVYMRK